MSTRKSVNKQQNSESPISSSSEQQQQQQNQDAGSESIEPPTTPTSKMTSSQTNLTDSKRKRRTNSIPSISTPKRSTSETSESPIIDPEKTLIKEIKQENSTPPPQTDSPRTRKKANEKSNITTVTTSTISTRKSAAAEAALKNAPTRTSLRSKNAKKNASPNETGTPKGGARTSRKKAEPASTPLKRERLNSNQSENEMDEKPDLKKVKIEKVEVEEEEPEEEILMEIRTEILDELKAKEEVKVIEIKDENLDSEVDLKESHIEDEVKETCDESTPASENLENNSSVDSSKENEVQIVDTPAKVVSLVDHDEIKTKVENENHKIENHIPEEDKVLKKEEDTAKDKEDSSSSTTQKDDNTKPDENEEKKEIDSKKKEEVVNVEPEKKRLTRRKPSILVTTPSKKGSTVKKDADPQKPARRARVQRAAAAAALTKTLSKTKKVVKSTENTNNKPSTKSPVPENTDESDTTKPQVPESIEDDELNNSTNVELIFSTTTNPTNRDKLDQSHEPLLIDTSTQNSEGKDSIPSTECTAGSEKSDSLSPVELESEGVSAVCVKEFYKEPQFLENNLGIEKDPKLGGIVQTVDIVDPKLDIMESTSLAELTPNDNSKETENTANTLDTAAVNEKECKMDTDEKEDSIVLVVNPAISNESIVTSLKTPEITEANEESDLSDTIKEGELMLVLDDSTEEENSLSQKTVNEEVREEQLDAIIKEENVLMDSMEDDKQNKQEIHSESKIDVEIEPKENQQDLTLPSEEIILTVHTVDKKDLNEDGDVTKPDLVSDFKVDLNESESKSETNQEKTEKEPEEISKIKCSTMETAEEDEGNEKDTIEKESTTMEIDSGVSDVAENNSTDPNEDLNLIHEIIGCAKQKVEISDSECSANAKTPSVSVANKVVLEPAQKNLQILDITPVKPYIAKEEKKDIPHITIKISETPETLKQKETHLKSLGLLTIKAADEAKIEKQKRRQQLNVSTPSTSKKVNGTASTTSDSSSGSSCSSNSSTSSTSSSSSEPNTSNGNGSNASGSNDNSSKSGQEYTGTLKTVIKLNRPTGTPIQSSDKKKHHHSNGNSNGQSSVTANSMALVPVANTNVSGRMPLKITLQKGRGRGTHLERHANGSHHSSEHAYYTIQNETEAGTQDNVTHGRKSHHYRINIDQTAASETSTAEKAEVLIPEKASSFAIHPGRLCQDQCFYCGGKFGLYDTPCHVAQLKSAERQKKILENEEKLTVDNCLCDACFRHLDRRANAAAAQKKRLSAPANIESHGGDHVEGGANSSIEGTGNDTMPLPHGHSLAKSVCFVTNCGQRASHTFRRKGFRKTIKKLLGDDIDLTNMGGRLPICDKHYEIIIQCLECALCKRRLIKNHMHHITQDVQLLESLLVKQGIPVKLQANPAVCKLCRYFTNLLIKPPEGRTQKAQFVKNYRRRLLHFHNIQQSDEGSEVEGQEDTLEKSKSPSPVKRGRKPKKLSQSQTSQNQMQRTSGTSEDGISDEIVDLDPDPVQSTPTASSGQMQLDNDVMVDYDLPVLCDTPSPPATSKSSSQPQQASKLQAILQSGGRSNDDISLVLRSHPNISMRELFPGEEDLGLQVNVPFGSSSSQRTPEGWTRIQTFLQYDEPTRRLWEDLQKPYGNQSSFLRHLILLEKYFRNGDLILSQNASTTATAYSETVQNRLHSYDYSVSSPQTATNKNNSTATSTITSRNTNKLQQQQQQQQPQKLQINPSLNTNNISSANGNIGSNNMIGNNNMLMSSVPDPIKKLHSNLTITITPKTRLIPDTAPVTTSLPIASSTPTTTCTTTSSGNSILKSNLLSRKNSAIEIIPISSGSSNTETNSRPVMTSLTKQQKLLAAANQLMGEEKSSNSINSPLTSMYIGASQNHQPKHHNLPPELISLNRNNPNSLLIGSRNMFGGANTSLKSKTHSNMHLQTHSQLPSHRPRIAPTIIKLPGTLAPHERMASKHWRPTLMPINTGPLRSAPGVLYQTADGRKLPSLVQVQSGGKPYLISIHDYNRMCILRREKLMRDQMMKNGKVSGNTSSMNSGGNSLLKGALSSNSGINSSNSSSTNSPSVSSVVSLSNSVSKSILSQGSKQW